MEKVVIIGANDFQNPLIKKAKEMGYETHVFAWQDGSIGEKTADYFYPISITEKEKILEECKRIRPQAIASIGSDLATITVNYLADKLGLPANNPQITLQCTNKYEMRKTFLQAGVSVPKFQKVKNTDELAIDDFKYPIIVKPTDRSGSRGVFLCSSKAEVVQAIPKACNISFEKNAIIEEYIDGEEYSCECITQNGEHTFLAVTKKYTTGSPNFIEKGHIQPANLSLNQIEKIKAEIFKGLTALKIENSASHSEFKIDNNGNIKIIEIGARMGGDCIGSDLVQISTGYDFLELVLNVAIGKKIELKQKSNPQIAIIKFIFDENDIKELQVIENSFPQCLHYKSKIQITNKKIIDSSSRYGFYILSCKPEDLEQINNTLGYNFINSLL